MKNEIDERPLLKMTIDVLMILFILILVQANGFQSSATEAKAVAAAAEGRASDAEDQASDAENRADEAEGKASDAESRASDAEGQASDAENRADEAEGRASDAADRARKAEEEGKRKDEALNKLRPSGPVDLVLIPDCSGSMELHHERLKKAQMALFLWMPRLSSECRIGVLGVRDGVVYRYPLKTIRPPSEDKSQADLLAFMATMKTVGSPINHAPAFEEAFSMLPDSNRNGRKQVIIVLGDIGPSELDGKLGYSPSEMNQAKRLVSNVRAWASKGNRAVGSIYVGPDNPSSVDRKWFQSLAQPAGQNFASDSTELFNVIFRSIEQ